MKGPKVVFAIALIAMACSCSRKQAPNTVTLSVEQKRATMTSVSRSVEEQNRLNGFFFAAVLPKLESCWSHVQGKGGIAFHYTYKREGTKWVWGGQEIEKSNLSPEQQQAALQCMQEAAKGSSFQMEALEAVYNMSEIHIHWAWPVPFPPNTSDLAKSVGGAGELPGYGCRDCNLGDNFNFECESATSGYLRCTVSDDRKSCTLGLPACYGGAMGGGGFVFSD